MVLSGVLFLVPKVAYLSQVDPDKIIELTNEERAKNNILPLVPSSTLTLVALNKARDLLEKNYFAHTNPEGKEFYEWIEEMGYRYNYVGENLAMNFVTNEGAIEAWMKSEKHRQNILEKRFKEIGVAKLTGKMGDKQTTIIVQIFGTKIAEAKPLSLKPILIEVQKNQPEIIPSLVKKSKKDYLDTKSAFILPRFLSYNTFDIFVPKTDQKTDIRHNNLKKLAVLNSSHLKYYSNSNKKDVYKGIIDKNEFVNKKINIKILSWDENGKFIQKELYF